VLSYDFQIMALVNCPNCGKAVEFEGNEYRPFCSERCQLLDLGAWADGDYALPTEDTELTEADIEQIERALETRE